MEQTARNIRGKVWSFLIGIFILVTLLAAVYTIESGSVGVLSTAGKYDMNERQPGLHFKIPFLQSIYTMDIKTHTVNYLTKLDLAKDGEGIINMPAITVLDSKNLPIGIDLTVQYTPLASEAGEILSTHGRDYFMKMINHEIRDIVRDIVGKYEAESIAIDRTKIAQEFKIQLDAKFAGTQFIIGAVSLRDIELPTLVRKKIEEVQEAKQEEQKLEMVEKQALKNQKIKTTQANTLRIEIETKAKAEAEKKKIEADARAYQITKEADATAAANIKIAQSVTEALIKYNFVTRWDGAYPKTYLGGDKNGLMVNIGDAAQ